MSDSWSLRWCQRKTALAAGFIVGAAGLIALAPAAGAASGTGPGSQVFTYQAGAPVQSYVVPAGVTQVTVDATGGRGGDSPSGAPGGGGADMHTVVPVTPGETLNVVVGGDAGADGNTCGAAVAASCGGPGAGPGGSSAGQSTATSAGGGGGASRVSSGAETLVVAAGGGGGGGLSELGGPAGGIGGNAMSPGGDGNPMSGASSSANGGGGGGAGSATSGGSGGIAGSGGGGACDLGLGGTAATASDGAGGVTGEFSESTGAGGGGWFGGGSGATGSTCRTVDTSMGTAGGGGGGSNYTAPQATGTTSDISSRPAGSNGQVVITYAAAAPAITSPSSGSTLPAATVGQAYSTTVTATGIPTPTFTATGLPPGLSIDPASGVISGTPTAAANFTIEVDATNSIGAASATYTLPVANPTPPPSKADLSVSISGPSGTVRSGSHVTFTITVTNHGPATATGVATVFGLTGVNSVAATGPTWQGSIGSVSGVVFIDPSLASNATVTYVVTGTAARSGSPMVGAAVTRSTVTDPKAANNLAAYTNLVR